MSDHNGHSNRRFGGVLDPIAVNQFVNVVRNAYAFRNDMFRQSFDPRRNLDEECGYPSTEGGIGVGDINPELYRSLYEREALASRVVQVYPKESWQVNPTIWEDEDPDTITPFEEAWDSLSNNMRGGERSWFQGEKGSQVWDALKRADILSGIGHFGVLLLGIDDGLRLDQPAEGVVETDSLTGNALHQSTAFEVTPIKDSQGHTFLPVYTVNARTGLMQRTSWREVPCLNRAPQPSQTTNPQGTDLQYVGVQFGPSERPSESPSKGPRKLLYLRPFDESLVQVVQYEANVANPRFGRPVVYLITLNDPREQHSGIGLPLATVRVHWSRVIHVADNLGSSEVFGVPRQRPVLNRLLDCRKVYGADGEGYWKACFTGISLETHPQLGGDVELNVPALQDMVENYDNGLQRWLMLTGMAAKTLAPSVTDPSPHLAVQIEAICVQLGIPVRVFKGSERGELASSQDDDAWLDRLRERQNNYLTPRVICPFVDRLIMTGVLPEPKGYSVEWPGLDALGEKDKVGIGLTKTQALAAYVSGQCETVVPPKQYLTIFLGMTDEEADSILTEAKDAASDPMTMPGKGQLGNPATATPPPPAPMGAGLKPPPVSKPGPAGGASIQRPQTASQEMND